MSNRNFSLPENTSNEIREEMEEIAHGIQAAAAACKYIGAINPLMGDSTGAEAGVIECIGGYLDYLSLRANKISGIDP